MSNRTTGQTLLLVLGAVILVGGLIVLGTAFATVAGGDVETDDASPLVRFAAGGFAMVVGFGIIAFTRASILTRGGAYSRITIEQGRAPGGGRFCSGCGHPATPGAAFCDSCGQRLPTTT